MQFTIFTDTPGGGTGFFIPNKDGGSRSLEECIQFVLDWASAWRERHRPVAWAPEATKLYGGTKIPEALRRESIAAGRLIEQVDGKYVAQGTQPAMVINRGSMPQETINPNAAMILRDKEAMQRSTTMPLYPRTPFDPFKDLNLEVTGGFTPQPLTNGREFGAFVSPDEKLTENLVDPSYAMAAERSR